MSLFKTLSTFVVAFSVPTVFASGFALYQPSVISHAMGGALVGKAMDASANFNNPATLTDLTNITVTVGFVTEHPRGAVRGSKNGQSWGDDVTMDPGLFWLPHVQLAIPLPADFAFGLGMGADYGLGTVFPDGWQMNWSTTDTTVQGFVINPNLAYKITDDWSVGVGLRWLFFDFEQYSNPQIEGDMSQYGFGVYDVGTASNRLKGDNRWRSLGWQIGTKYDITKTFSVGAVYKSAINVTVDGKTTTNVKSYNDQTINALSPYLAMMRGIPVEMARQYLYKTIKAGVDEHNGHAEADLTLPQSVTLGCNWDVFPTWHLGAAVSWTEWSEFDQLHFKLAGGDRDTKLNWRDTWRGSIGSCWDFAEDWKWMISYVYDMDSTDATQESAMLPPADRHIAATGFVWNVWRNMDLALSYSCIFMDGRGMDTTDAFGNRYHLETCRGFCHAAGFSVTYRF